MKTKIIPILILFAFNSTAQTVSDALRYSGGSITGTARYSAMGGAFGALGGDFTTLSYNPAGIAIYRSSEFTFTPSIYAANTSSNFIDGQFDDRKYNFNIGNAGLVFTHKISRNNDSPGWKSWNFGMGYNRLDNFHTRTYYEGMNVANSMTDNFAEVASGQNYDVLDPFYEYLAYSTYLINPDSLNNYSGVFPNGHAFQKRSSETRGCIGETVFSFGGNYSNKFYIGATLGFKNLRYVETTYYEEYDNQFLNDSVTSYKFDQNITTTGGGIDFKTGIIYKPNDNLRFGFSFATPTIFYLHDDYKNFMTSRFDQGNVQAAESPNGEYDYDMVTSFSTQVSAAFIFGTKGLISADYQFNDPSETRFDGINFPYGSVNNQIAKQYRGVHTVRLGTEWKVDNVSLRGGYSFATSPMNDYYTVGESDFSENSFSGGIGFRDGPVFFDFGYVYTVANQYFQPYTLTNELVPGVKSRVAMNNYVATIGVKF